MIHYKFQNLHMYFILCEIFVLSSTFKSEVKGCCSLWKVIIKCENLWDKIKASCDFLVFLLNLNIVFYRRSISREDRIGREDRIPASISREARIIGPARWPNRRADKIIKINTRALIFKLYSIIWKPAELTKIPHIVLSKSEGYHVHHSKTPPKAAKFHVHHRKTPPKLAKCHLHHRETPPKLFFFETILFPQDMILDYI